MIVHLTRDHPPRINGGLSTAVGGLVRALCDAGVRQRVVSFDAWRPRKKKGAGPPRLDETNGIPVLRVEGPHHLDEARAFIETPDLVHVHDGFLDELAAEIDAPSVLTIHVAQGELRRLRQEEARAGGQHLGLSNYEFWGYPEGHLPGPSELVMVAERVAELVERTKPKTVYAPWIGEQHVDHHVLARGVRLGLELAGFTGRAWGYEVWTPLVPTRIVDVTGHYANKRRALAEHASQLEEIQGMLEKALAITAQRAMYLGPDARHGEAFRPLGPVGDADRALLD